MEVIVVTLSSGSNQSIHGGAVCALLAEEGKHGDSLGKALGSEDLQNVKEVRNTRFKKGNLSYLY